MSEEAPAEKPIDEKKADETEETPVQKPATNPEETPKKKSTETHPDKTSPVASEQVEKKEPFKLSYSAGKIRVKLEFSREATLNNDIDPEKLVGMAAQRMQKANEKGTVSYFVVHKTRFLETWKRVREAEHLSLDSRIRTNIAGGTPALEGVVIEKSRDDEDEAYLTITATKEEVGKWRYEWFKLYVRVKLRELGVVQNATYMPLHAAFLRAQTGLRVKNVLIKPIPQKVIEKAKEKTYALLANKKRREVGLVIMNPEKLQAEGEFKALLHDIMNTVKHLKEAAGGRYVILKNEITYQLKLAQSGPEALGVDLPLMLICAYGNLDEAEIAELKKRKKERKARQGDIKQSMKQHAKEIDAKTKGEKDKDKAKASSIPVEKLLKISVSDDQMEAVVENFDMTLYETILSKPDTVYIKKSLKNAGLPTKLDNEIMKNLIEAMDMQRDLSGFEILVGEYPESGENPYIHKSFEDAKSKTEKDLETAVIDIREMQQRSIVNTGELVAEIRYEFPPVAGKDIFGKGVVEGPDDDFSVEIGEGIEEKKPGKYYAAYDGIPAVSDIAVSVSKALVHEGDVNLKSGNIRFNGPVEINGSVDTGAVVDVGGDVIVRGTIRGGIVKTSGDLSVSDGIVMGNEGRVYVGGNLLAEFIENAEVVCRGSITVNVAIRNSKVIASDEINLVSEDGTIAGGMLSCWGTMKTANLGFDQGAETFVRVGVDGKSGTAIAIRKGRLLAVKKQQQDDRKELREIAARKGSQLTAKHKETKAIISSKLKKYADLISKLEDHLRKAKDAKAFNPDSQIYVRETLTQNCNIKIAGTAIAYDDGYAGVKISSKMKGGTFLSAIREADE